jgi:hypothetical protein
MKNTNNSLLPMSPQQVTSTIKDQLHEGTATGAEWQSPAQRIQLLTELGQSRMQLGKRQKELLRMILDDRESAFSKGELADNMLLQHRCFKQYCELVFGGKIKWDLLDSLRPLDECKMEYFIKFFKDFCREPRFNLVTWLDQAPLFGRFEGEDWQHCPEVWTLFRMIGVTSLNPATIAAVYFHLFKQFPSFPDIEPDASLFDKENSIQAITVKPIYAIWELREIAKSLGCKA